MAYTVDPNTTEIVRSVLKLQLMNCFSALLRKVTTEYQRGLRNAHLWCVWVGLGSGRASGRELELMKSILGVS